MSQTGALRAFYNVFSDVPVKLFAANLLLSLIFITLPDLPAMFRFFWLHQPVAPTGVCIPSASRRGFRIATRAIELVLVLHLSAVHALPNVSGLARVPEEQRHAAAHPG